MIKKFIEVLRYKRQSSEGSYKCQKGNLKRKMDYSRIALEHGKTEDPNEQETFHGMQNRRWKCLKRGRQRLRRGGRGLFSL